MRLRLLIGDIRGSAGEEFERSLPPHGRGRCLLCRRDPTPDAMPTPIVRQALAGLLWSKQWYHYDVAAGSGAIPPSPRRRLAGERPQPRLDPPLQRGRGLGARQVGVPLVRLVGSGLSRRRPGPRRPGLRQGPAHPASCASGTCTPTANPAYEWALGDVNPPVLPWAALRVYEIEKARRGPGDRPSSSASFTSSS